MYIPPPAAYTNTDRDYVENQLNHATVRNV